MSEREHWRYSGRGPTGPDDTDCYRWVRYIGGVNRFGHPALIKQGYALPVATFWPNNTEREADR